MNRRALFTALAATAALGLTACGNNDRAADQPAAQSSTVAQEQARMIIFVDPINCSISRSMRPDIEAFLATPAGRNVTVIDAASAEGYATVANYRLNGQAITQVPTIITLRGNEIVGSVQGRQSAAQLTEMLAAANRNDIVANTAIPQAANITAQYRVSRAP